MPPPGLVAQPGQAAVQVVDTELAMDLRLWQAPWESHAPFLPDESSAYHTTLIIAP